MRSRFIIPLLVAVVVTLAIAFWRQPVPSRTTLRQSQATPSNAPPAMPNAAGQVPQKALSVTGPIVLTSPTSSNISNARYLAETREFIENENRPVDFYGRVIDQDSNSLSGAKIKIAILHLTMPDPLVPELGSEDVHLERNSDPDGRFEFHGATGKGFGVEIAKDGYELEPNRYGFGPTAGSYDNPVVFKMWNTNIHEPLVTGKKSYEIVPDGRRYFINLADGSISEYKNGDLTVWITYTNQVVKGQSYDWSAGIEVINGGLLEVPQAAINSGFIGDPPFAMYSAPAEGYVPSFSVTNQVKGGQSGEIGDRYFYLRLNNGKKYGRMSINLFAPYGSLHPGLIRLSYAINPSGSGILR